MPSVNGNLPMHFTSFMVAPSIIISHVRLIVKDETNSCVPALCSIPVVIIIIILSISTSPTLLQTPTRLLPSPTPNFPDTLLLVQNPSPHQPLLQIPRLELIPTIPQPFEPHNPIRAHAPNKRNHTRQHLDTQLRDQKRRILNINFQKARREVRRRESGQVAIHDAAAVEVLLIEMYYAVFRRRRYFHQRFFVAEVGLRAEAGRVLLFGGFEGLGKLLDAGFAEVGEGGVGVVVEGVEEGVFVVGGGGGHGFAKGLRWGAWIEKAWGPGYMYDLPTLDICCTTSPITEAYTLLAEGSHMGTSILAL